MRYQDYLQSPQWKALRKWARERAENRCELCGGAAEHVHHVRYPKVFKSDHIDNLIVVCGQCHQKCHGIRGNKTMKIDFTSPMQFAFEGESRKHQVTVYKTDHENGDFFALSLYQLRQILLAERNENFHKNPLDLDISGNDALFESKVISIVDERAIIRCSDPFRGGVQVYILEPGVYQLLGRFSSPACKKFQQWLNWEVIPSIRRKGSYALQPAQGNTDQPLSGDVLEQHALQLYQQAKKINQLEKNVHRVEFQLAAAQREWEQEAERFDAGLEQLRLYTGGDYCRTVRLRMMEHGIKPTQDLTMKVGGILAKRCRDRGIKLPPKIAEGTVLANQYPIEVIDELLSEMKLISQRPH